MMSSTTLRPTFTGPRVPVAKSGRVAPSRATILRVRAGPYDEELIATAVRISADLCLRFGGWLQAAAALMWTAKAVNFGTISSMGAFQVGGRSSWLRAIVIGCKIMSSNIKERDMTGCSQAGA